MNYCYGKGVPELRHVVPILEGPLIGGSTVLVIFLNPLRWLSVILVNAFLALSVEKLSEIRDLEEDQSKEKESEEKERRQRTDKLTALRDPKFEIRRRTIRQMIKFQSSNPKERVMASVKTTPAGGGGRDGKGRSWWKQLSLPLFNRIPAESPPPPLKERRVSKVREYRKSVSTPAGSVTTPTSQFTYEGAETRGDSGSEGGVAGAGRQGTKKKNPLSYMQNPLSYADLKSSPGGSALNHDNVVPITAAASRLVRMQQRYQSPPPIVPPAIPEEGGAAEEGEGGSSAFSSAHRQMSTMSSPAAPGGMEVGVASAGGMRTTRSSSLPLGSSISTAQRVSGRGLAFPSRGACPMSTN